MSKPGIHVEIPGSGLLEIRDLVTDYTGTLSNGGDTATHVKGLLVELAASLDVHVLTSDTFGAVRRELAALPLRINILDGADHDRQKSDYVSAQCDPARVVALGNGVNDRLMLRAVKAAGGLAIAVDNGEGCSVEAMTAAAIFITGAANALGLLLDPRRLKATLRR